MLEQLFGSKTRWAIVRLFMNNPANFYYVRELTRILVTQINSVRRELEILTNLGLLEKTIKPFNNNKSLKKYYQLNKQFFMYKEIKALVVKEQMVFEKKFVGKLSALGDIYYLLFTGRFINEEEPNPTDLLIIGHVDREKLKKLIEGFEKELKHEINYTILNYKEFDYRQSVNDRFLRAILDKGGVVAVDRLAELETVDGNIK